MSVTPVSALASARPMAFSAASLRNAAPTEQRAAVAAQFEAILVRQLIGPSLSGMLGSGAGNGVAASVYGDLLTDTISQQLAAGQGLGLGRYLQHQLAPRGEKPADAAANPDATTPLKP